MVLVCLQKFQVLSLDVHFFRLELSLSNSELSVNWKLKLGTVAYQYLFVIVGNKMQIVALCIGVCGYLQLLSDTGGNHAVNNSTQLSS